MFCAKDMGAPCTLEVNACAQGKCRGSPTRLILGHLSLFSLGSAPSTLIQVDSDLVDRAPETLEAPGLQGWSPGRAGTRQFRFEISASWLVLLRTSGLSRTDDVCVSKCQRTLLFRVESMLWCSNVYRDNSLDKKSRHSRDDGGDHIPRVS